MADEKTRYWSVVAYPENFKENWQEEIDSILQLPYAYCIHDKDTLSNVSQSAEDRKKHVHIILCFSNTTTYKHAFNVFSGLNADGKKAFNKIERIYNIRRAYDYLIHNTDDAKKKKKYLYDESERITGNNFDIGCYEILSSADKEAILDELADIIINQNFMNFRDFWIYVSSELDSSHKELARSHHGFLEALTRGNFLNYKMGKMEKGD